MACCGKSAGVVDTAPADLISMSYLGSNTGTIRFDGFLRRSYRVVRGSVVNVHPDDVARLSNTGKFMLTPKQNTAVSTPKPAPVAPVIIAEPVQAEAVEFDATDGAIELAQANDIDLALVRGTGAGGRIVLRDVKALISE